MLPTPNFSASLACHFKSDGVRSDGVSRPLYTYLRSTSPASGVIASIARSIFESAILSSAAKTWSACVCFAAASLEPAGAVARRVSRSAMVRRRALPEPGVCCSNSFLQSAVRRRQLAVSEAARSAARGLQLFITAHYGGCLEWSKSLAARHPLVSYWPLAGYETYLY